MKLSKTGWVILAIGILAITFGSLGASRSQRLTEGKQMRDELAIAKTRLSKLDLTDLYSRQANLQAQISKVTSQLQTEQSALSQRNDSITITDAVFQIAADSGVEVTQMSSSSLARAKLGNVDCLALCIETMVKGDLPSLIDFVTRLNRGFPTGQVKVAEIVILAASDNASADSNSSARVQLAVNAYQGG